MDAQPTPLAAWTPRYGPVRDGLALLAWAWGAGAAFSVGALVHRLAGGGSDGLALFEYGSLGATALTAVGAARLGALPPRAADESGSPYRGRPERAAPSLAVLSRAVLRAAIATVALQAVAHVASMVELLSWTTGTTEPNSLVSIALLCPWWGELIARAAVAGLFAAWALRASRELALRVPKALAVAAGALGLVEVGVTALRVLPTLSRGPLLDSWALGSWTFGPIAATLAGAAAATLALVVRRRLAAIAAEEAPLDHAAPAPPAIDDEKARAWGTVAQGVARAARGFHARLAVFVVAALALVGAVLFDEIRAVSIVMPVAALLSLAAGVELGRGVIRVSRADAASARTWAHASLALVGASLLADVTALGAGAFALVASTSAGISPTLAGVLSSQLLTFAAMAFAAASYERMASSLGDEDLAANARTAKRRAGVVLAVAVAPVSFGVWTAVAAGVALLVTAVAATVQLASVAQALRSRIADLQPVRPAKPTKRKRSHKVEGTSE